MLKSVGAGLFVVVGFLPSFLDADVAHFPALFALTTDLGLSVLNVFPMTALTKFSNCTYEHNIPSSSPFITSCNCGMQIFRNTSAGLVFQYLKPKVLNQRTESVGRRIYDFVWTSLLFIGLVALLTFGYKYITQPKETQGNQVNNSIAPSGEESSNPQPKNTVLTYTGNCTQYKLTLVNRNQKKCTAVTKALAKITIDHTAKKFTFTFNGKVVYTYSPFDSYRDNDRGVEGFTLGGDSSAQRDHSRGTFTVYNSYFGGNSADLGYEYEMSNYKTN